MAGLKQLRKTRWSDRQQLLSFLLRGQSLAKTSSRLRKR